MPFCFTKQAHISIQQVAVCTLKVGLWITVNKQNKECNKTKQCAVVAHDFARCCCCVCADAQSKIYFTL